MITETDTSTIPACERNLCVILGCLAEKLAGPCSIAILTDATLSYLLKNITEGIAKDVMLFSLIALEKFAQTAENKSTIKRKLSSYPEHPLLNLEKHSDESRDFTMRQVGFCAQWSLDNYCEFPYSSGWTVEWKKSLQVLIDGRDYTYTKCDTSNLNVMWVTTFLINFISLKYPFPIKAEHEGCQRISENICRRSWSEMRQLLLWKRPINMFDQFRCLVFRGPHNHKWGDADWMVREVRNYEFNLKMFFLLTQQGTKGVAFPVKRWLRYRWRRFQYLIWWMPEGLRVFIQDSFISGVVKLTFRSSALPAPHTSLFPPPNVSHIFIFHFILDFIVLWKHFFVSLFPALLLSRLLPSTLWPLAMASYEQLHAHPSFMFPPQ